MIASFENLNCSELNLNFRLHLEARISRMTRDTNAQIRGGSDHAVDTLSLAS